MKSIAVFLLAACALSVRADDGPEAVVRSFYDAYAAGDLQTASSYWDPSAAPAFLRRAERHLRIFCLTHHEITIDAPVTRENTATVDAEALVGVSSVAAGFRPRTETRFTSFELVRADRWRITRWFDRETALADRAAALKSVEERRAMLDAAGRLRTPRLARALCLASHPLLNRGEVAQAQSMVAIAREIALETNDDAALAIVLGLEGSILLKGRKPELAIEKDTEAVAVAERSGEPDAIARSLLRLGTAEYAVRFDIPGPVFERILGLSEFVEDVTVLANASSHLGFAAIQRADATSELRHGLRALKWAEMGGQPAALYNASTAIGEAYYLLGYTGLSLRHHERALAIAESAGWADTITQTLMQMAMVYESAHRRKESRAAIERALRTAPDDIKSNLLATRAYQALDEGRLADAEKDVQEIMRLFARGSRWSAVGLLWMSQVRLAQGRAAEALEMATESLCLYPQTVHRGRLQALSNAITALRRMNRLDEAGLLAGEMRRLLAEWPAVEGYEEKAWNAAFSSNTEYEAQLIALAVDTGDAATAIRLANENRARALRALIAHRGDLPSRLMNPAERERARTIALRIAELNRQILEPGISKAASATLLEQLETARLDLDELRASSAVMRAEFVPRPPSVADTLALAPEHAVLHYVATEDEILIIAAGPRTGETRRIIAKRARLRRKELSRKIETLRRYLQSRDLRYATAARELYDVLVAPVESLIGPDHALCIIPDRELWRVPFHALRAPDGKYLVERTALFYAPAMSLADHAGAPRSDAAPTLVAFANPELHASAVAHYRSAFAGAEVGRLPEAEKEVLEVARLYGNRSRVYLGENATEATLKSEASRADILHIATHGAVDPASPFASAILLAPGAPSEDGVLEAGEILDLDLRASLAVLSACETGAGSDKTTAEGLLGLSWAVLATGCPTAVVSQWKATSTVASELMIELHRGLRSGETAAVALQKAQQRLLRESRYRHPYYWAPFVVIGAQ